MTEQEQIAGLLTLQRVAGAYEINTVLHRTPGDVAYVAAVDVPKASQVCFTSGKGYDVWRDGQPGGVGLDVGAAANVVIMEYITEKVRRAKRCDMRLRKYTDDELIGHLLKGYQGERSVAQ